jgi:hypothetical protein
MALHSAIKGKLICVIGDEVGTRKILFGKIKKKKKPG